jgi:hypothetical protein
MRIFAGKLSLSCVCSTPLALGPGGLASLQARSLAPMGAPRMPGRNGDGIQVRPARRPEYSPLSLRDDPQFVADCSKFLTEHGGVVIGSIHAPLPQEQNGVATQNMLLHAIAWAGKQPVDEPVNYKPPPVPQRQ